MTTNLTNISINESFDQLLHVSDGPTATEKTVYSGTGVATALHVGTASASIGDVRFSGDTITTITTDADLVLDPNGTGVVDIARVAFGDAAQARGALSLGTMATQDSGAVAITGGSIADVTFTGSFTGITGITSDAFYTTAAAAGLTLTANDLLADGTDTNIDIDITPKGSGAVIIPKLEVTGSFGYAPTAGGSVVQATSKSTAVTINKLCGQITTHNATLNRDTSVNFVVNNSLVGEFDVVVACIHSGATLGAYELDVDNVSAGAFTLALRNHLATTDLSEVVVINFVVIKGTIT